MRGKPEKGGQARGHVEVVVHGCRKPLLKAIDRLVKVGICGGRFREMYFLNEFVQMEKGVFNGGKLGMGKEDRFSIVTAEQPVSNFSSRVPFGQKVSQGQMDAV